MTNNIANVIAYEIPHSFLSNPTAPQLSQPAIAKMFKGQVSTGLRWLVEPAAGWLVDKLAMGLYRITHNQNKLFYSVNLSTPNGSVVAQTENYFDVQLTNALQTPQDGEFSFAVSFMG